MVRYIDADRMRENWLENGENEYLYDTNAVLESIDAQPTADVVEVVHGYWIDAYPEIEPNPMFAYGICSVCGCKQSISDKLAYCMDCGAKMDGKKVQDDL